MYWFIYLDVVVDMLDTIDLTPSLGIGLQLHEEDLSEDDGQRQQVHEEELSEDVWQRQQLHEEELAEGGGQNQAAAGMYIFVVHVCI